VEFRQLGSETGGERATRRPKFFCHAHSADPDATAQRGIECGGAFITLLGGGAAWPVPAWPVPAQQRERMIRTGVRMGLYKNEEEQLRTT
jgi:hypothetical protein